MARGGNPLAVEARRNRSYLLYGFSIVIMVIIGVSMIGTLAPSGVGASGSTLVFGTFDGRDISYSPNNFFGAAYDFHAREQAAQASADGDQRLAAWAVWRRAFNDTVLHTARVQHALAGGLAVSQQSVDEELIRTVASYDALKEMPTAEREGILERLREQLIRRRYAEDLTNGRLVGGNEADFYARMIGHERRFEFVGLNYDAYPDSEVAAYGAANAASFRRMDLSLITVAGGADAAGELRERILTGAATFEEEARARSQDPSAAQGGDLGFRYFHEVDRDFADAATTERIFALAEGEVSEPLDGLLEGVRYLYRADSRVIEPDFTDADTLATVRAYLDDSERGRMEDYLLAQADRFAVAAAQSDFHTAADDLGLTVHATEWFPINFRNVTAPRRVEVTGGLPLLEGAADLEAFFEQGFALQRIGDVSAPIRLPDQVVVLSLLDERRLSAGDLRPTGDAEADADAADRHAAASAAFRVFAADALLEDLVWWVNGGGLLEDDFNETFAVLTGGP